MQIRKLKTDSDVFQETWDGLKTYEVRLDDRNFAVGDILLLKETRYTGEEMKAGKPLVYTGRTVRCRVIQKLSGRYGLKDGWCILGISVLDRLVSAAR